MSERPSADHEVTVRRAVQEDDAALLAIEKISWDASSGFPSYQDNLTDTFFARSGPEAHLVAEYDGEVVGYLRLQNKYPFPEGAGVLTINGLATAPTARRLGVGSALLDAATAEGRLRGARKISLHVHSTNAAARRLYERHGYIVEGTHPNEFLIEGDLIAALDMAKML
ncbi:ribosomal protein S18 acetylase RimI-like enzyme [Kribbella rubisoli]|uniref:Ribosomal protein S18 acetylase RimI-like enzyme n=1 Tax=Kribbella rubisoli TaxID=3075929 RepID=A0A4Q7X994_9ACTN|nr:GNAT family N-acetyltransferase [Kribbella rubisoli]RZU19628.1 ribosomal protein S18 acetylase RimI-like enzyme [Kribbella rubisoli]